MATFCELPIFNSLLCFSEAVRIPGVSVAITQGQQQA
jgi:hypothetical protein